MPETQFCPQCKEHVPFYNFLYNENNSSYSRNKGGCTDCTSECEKCHKIIAFEESDVATDDRLTLVLCEDCLHKDYILCDKCQKYFNEDNITLAENKSPNEEGYVEGEGINVCKKCLSKYYKICFTCKNPVEKSIAINFLQNYYHDFCIPDEQPELLDFSSVNKNNFKNFTWSEQEHILNFLEKLTPISVKDIKEKYNNLYIQIKDLIKENNGKDFTLDYIKNKKNQLKPKLFEVDYSSWFSTQRSYVQSEPQIILKIKTDNDFLSIINNDPYYKILFYFSQLSNNERGHPYSNNMLGWARLEINPLERYILVDEIQTDYQIYGSKILNSIKLNDSKYQLVKNELLKSYHEELSQIQVKEIKNFYDYIIEKIKSFQKLFDKFPQIAISAIEKFAKANNFIKIYYPTFGTLIELRDHKNDDGTISKKLPSKEIYENLPKKHFYEDKGNYPFDFKNLKFYEKNASINKITKLFYKRINKL